MMYEQKGTIQMTGEKMAILLDAQCVQHCQPEEYLMMCTQTDVNSPAGGAFFPVSFEYGRYPIVGKTEAKATRFYTNRELNL